MSLSVDVHLLSGKRVSLETREDATVERLSQSAQCALAVGKGRLLSADGHVLDATQTLRQANVRSGDDLFLQLGRPLGHFIFSLIWV